MAFDDVCHIQHETITEIEVKFVANFVEPVVQGKGCANKIEELFANIYFNFHVIRRLNQVMFLFLGFLRFGEVIECMGYALHDKYPNFFKASAYDGIALSNDSPSHNCWAILLLIISGSCLVMEGGWLYRVLM